MRKPIKVDEIAVQMSSDQLSQRLLSSVVRDKSPLLEIFSYELSAVAPALFHNNGETRKTNKAALMNAIIIVSPNYVTKNLCYHVFDGCAWLYQVYWAKVGIILDLYKSFLQSIIAECGTSGNHISVIFDGYRTKSTKGPEQKRRKKNLNSVDIHK